MKFPAAPVRSEVGFIRAAQKRALVMIEPPREARIAGILEVDNGIFVAVKLHVQKELARAMRKTLVLKPGGFADCIQVKAAENSCGGKAIEAIVMKIDLHYPHTVLDLAV
jgi:hypothetical protein